MKKPKQFRTHEGVGAPLLVDHIDTDQIIPSREMKKVGRDGLSDGLFAGWRYASPGSRTPNPDFVLNKDGFGSASVILSGVNFGCGSSREHAVWALAEFGVRCIIAESFGEIFHANCGRNGILPIVLKKEEITALADYVCEAPEVNLIAIDLVSQRITAKTNPSILFSFYADIFQKRLLTEGLNPIQLTLKRRTDIDAFFEKDRLVHPWLYR